MAFKDFVKKLIDDDQKEVKKLSRIAEKIVDLEAQCLILADADFPRKTQEFK